MDLSLSLSHRVPLGALQNKKIGFIIDLTNTDRFYDAEGEVKNLKIKHYALRCRG